MRASISYHNGLHHVTLGMLAGIATSRPQTSLTTICEDENGKVTPLLRAGWIYNVCVPIHETVLEEPKLILLWKGSISGDPSRITRDDDSQASCGWKDTEKHNQHNGSSPLGEKSKPSLPLLDERG